MENDLSNVYLKGAITSREELKDVFTGGLPPDVAVWLAPGGP